VDPELKLKTKRHRKRFRDAERRRIVAEWRQSGLSAYAFAKQAGVNASNLWRWASDVERQTLPAVASVAPIRSESFVELQLSRPEAAPSAPITRLPMQVQPHFEIEGPLGLRVRVYPGADVETLCRLLSALPGGDRC
jgi:transposase-like protein